MTNQDAVIEEQKEQIQDVFEKKILKLCETCINKKNYFQNPENLRIIMILIRYPRILDKWDIVLIQNFLEVIYTVPKEYHVNLATWFTEFDKQTLNLYLKNLQSAMMILVYNGMEQNQVELYEKVDRICFLISIIYKSNKIQNRLAKEEFYCSDLLEAKELTQEGQEEYVVRASIEYKLYAKNKKHGTNLFTFINYPYLLDINFKQQILEAESKDLIKAEQIKEFGNSQQNFLQNLSSMNIYNPLRDLYLNLTIKRNQILEDALNQLSSNNINLKLQLKVKFLGEEGEDQGGVRKEFFQLMTQRLFNLDYGMFISKNNNKFLWFNGQSYEIPLRFELVGIIIGLAIYNQIILDVKFPQVIYKKLLNEPYGLEDIKEIDYQHYQNLKYILSYQGDDLEDLLYYNFTVEYECFFERFTYELKENGENIMINQQNKQEYVDLYVDWLLNKSIKVQFEAFKKGFNKVVTTSDMIKLFSSEELGQIIIGCEELDFVGLRQGTRYADGYNENSEVVKWFWQIIEELTFAQKKKLLCFITGSDRAPIQGLKSYRLIIVRQPGDSEKLPTASTCFLYLFLPEYSSIEQLRKKINLAIDNSEGFGLL